MAGKIKSRKLWVFIIWAFLGLYMVFNKMPLDVFIPNFMIISTVYIGGQSAVDFIDKKRS